MSRIVKIARTLRNNWKKTVFFSGLATWGSYWGYGKRVEFNLMNAYSKEAVQFGQQRLSPIQPSRHVTVILNPVANKKQAKNDYEKYCAPLFNLAGLKVSVVITEAEGQAKDLMEIMQNTDCVVIAGGDGTVHEAITGLLRRADNQNAVKQFPVGILPVGKLNSIAFRLNKKTFTPGDIKAKILGESSMSVIREMLTDVDVMKIEGEEGKSVYSLGHLNMGQLRNTMGKLDQYWYLGQRMKPYLTFFFQSFKNLSTFWDENVAVEVAYTKPCSGCSKCYERYADLLPPTPNPLSANQSSNRWWSGFMSRPKPQILPPDSKALELARMKATENEECDQWQTLFVNSKNILVRDRTDTSQLEMIIHPCDLKRSQFVSEGIRLYKDREFESGKEPPFQTLLAKDYRIILPQMEVNNKEEGQTEGGEETGVHGNEEETPSKTEGISEDITDTFSFSVNKKLNEKVSAKLKEVQVASPTAIRELDEEPTTATAETTTETATTTTTEKKKDNALSSPADGEEDKSDEHHRWLSIDNEAYECQRSLRISLLPRKVQIYHNQ